MTTPEAFQAALLHYQNGRLTEAEAIYREILAVEPRHPDALHRLGLMAHQTGRNDMAVEMILRAIAVVPTAAVLHCNLGTVYRKLGRSDLAAGAYGKALELAPDLAEAHYNLGNVFRDQGQFSEAAAAYRCAIHLKPEDADAHNNLGLVLRHQGKLTEAMVAYHRAIDFGPGNAEAHNNLGAALTEQGRAGEAMAAFRRAIEIQPGYAVAHHNLGNAFMEQGQLDEAMAAYREAIRLRPDYVEAHSNLLCLLQYMANADADLAYREHCRWSEVHAGPLLQWTAPSDNEADPKRKLRIGYVSPDFRQHPVAFFFEGLLASHDRAQVEVYCYADWARADEVSERLRARAGQWRPISGLRDEQVTEMIRRDRIDILVDLAGHTPNNRLLVFARKPAPIQISYLGYCATTGMGVMDYRLTDACADPPGATECLHSEKLIRLPDTAWCFRAPENCPPVAPLPASLKGHITFGSFNAMTKITEPMLSLWGSLLMEVPGSRLFLKNKALGIPSVQRRTGDFITRIGVAADRLELVGTVPTWAEHFSMYGRMDIALDTFPYDGTTTTCEALWMGVPVITLAGRTHAARVGVSLLHNVGLPELVAQNEREYLRTAAQLTTDLDRLAQLRATLRARIQASPLMDAPRFARNVEEAYRQMWGTWCAQRRS